MKGITKKDIKKYEKEANILLPIDYKEWLLSSNDGGIFDLDITFYEIEKLNMENQKLHNMFAFPISYLTIGKFNFGDLICINLNTGEIVQWDHETNEEFLKWNTFWEFLEEESKK